MFKRKNPWFENALLIAAAGSIIALIGTLSSTVMPIMYGSEDISDFSIKLDHISSLFDAQNISNYNGEEKRLSQRYDKAESGFKVQDKTKRIQNDYSVRPNEKHADNVIKTGKANTRSLVSQTETGVGHTVQKYTKPNQQKTQLLEELVILLMVQERRKY